MDKHQHKILDRWPGLKPGADPERVRLYTVDTGPKQKGPPPVFYTEDDAARSDLMRTPGARVESFFRWFYKRLKLPLVVFDRESVKRPEMIEATKQAKPRRKRPEGMSKSEYNRLRHREYYQRKSEEINERRRARRAERRSDTRRAERTRRRPAA